MSDWSVPAKLGFEYGAVALGYILIIIGGLWITTYVERRRSATVTPPSGKGWEILVEEAQAVARRAVEDLQLANTAIRVQRREIAELKFENIRLQAELAEKDMPTS